jgi:lipid-A-disaccharide synthase
VTIGHPLADQLPQQPDRHAAKHALGIEDQAQVLAVLPGSRKSEWRYHAPVFFETVEKLLALVPNLVVLVPCLTQEMQHQLQSYATALPIRYVVDSQGASQVLTAADAALIVSGTATLESALCHTPMVVGYQMHQASYWLMSKLVKTRWIALPNIIENQQVVPEFVQDQMTVDHLVAAVHPLLLGEGADEQLLAFDRIHAQLQRDAAQSSVKQITQWWQAA